MGAQSNDGSGEDDETEALGGGARDGDTLDYTRQPESGSRKRAGAGAQGWDAGGPQVPAAVVERYEILGDLPTGGETYRVLRVLDRLSGHQRVVKLYHKSHRQADDVLRGLQRAVHRHVVTVHSFGTEPDRSGGWPWEVLEYLPGGSLKEFLSRRGRLPEPQVRRVLEQLTDALHHLHTRLLGRGRGATHRDVKPGNILLRGATGPLDVALGDFGLMAEARDTWQTAGVAGTGMYQAPETFFTARRDPSQDWWSLGVVVVEILTGRNPNSVPGGWSDPRELFTHLATHDVDLSGVTDTRWLRLCQGLLTREPEHRWGHAQVTDWLRGGTPAVHREPPAPPAPPPHRRSGKPLGLAGETHHDLESAARAMTGPLWEDALALFLSPPRLAALRTWLEREFDSGGIPEYLVAQPAADLREAAVRAATFRAAVLRDAPPEFADGPADAPALCARAASTTPQDQRVAAVVSGDLLRVFASHPCASRTALGHGNCAEHCEVLTEAAAVLPRAEEELRSCIAELTAALGPGSSSAALGLLAPLHHRHEARALLLRSVLDPETVRWERRRIAARRRTTRMQACDWWMRLSEAAVRDRETPARLVLARMLLKAAETDGLAELRKPGGRNERRRAEAAEALDSAAAAVGLVVSGVGRVLSAVTALAADVVAAAVLFVASLAGVYVATTAWLTWADGTPETRSARYASTAADLQYVLSVPLAVVLLAVVLRQRRPGPATGVGAGCVLLTGGLLALALWTGHGGEIRFPYLPGGDFHGALLDADRRLGGDPRWAAGWLAGLSAVGLALLVGWAYRVRRARGGRFGSGHRPRPYSSSPPPAPAGGFDVWVRLLVIAAAVALLLCSAQEWPVPFVPGEPQALW
ncbi:serine/threonine-protein kinase [Streptomyces sp. NPDC005820]|uniref:serine/threonine-protein kinase n=1 Tax=Streptomyces sp. NPDC005820 TaxID=3157069 RepID=UPI00340752F8